MTLEFPTRAERPGRLPHIASLRVPDWPEYLNHDAVLNRLFGRVIAEYAQFQFYAWDDEREQVFGVGNAVPAAWDGALQILIAPECRGQGLSPRMIERMAEIGRDHGLDTLIAPVRPMWMVHARRPATRP